MNLRKSRGGGGDCVFVFPKKSREWPKTREDIDQFGNLPFVKQGQRGDRPPPACTYAAEFPAYNLPLLINQSVRAHVHISASRTEIERRTQKILQT